MPEINPRDGKFEVLVTPKASLGSKLRLSKEGTPQSTFFAEELDINGKASFTVYVDGKKHIYKNIHIKILPKKLNLI
mgnify:FL=1